jgi:hypothetical protein
MPAIPAPMTAKCLALGLLAGFDVDLGEAAGLEDLLDLEDGLDGLEAEEAAKGWLLEGGVADFKSEVFGLRLRFIS